jgi:hypothetical protein
MCDCEHLTRTEFTRRDDAVRQKSEGDARRARNRAESDGA